jgi:hypothetical protein
MEMFLLRPNMKNTAEMNFNHFIQHRLCRHFEGDNVSHIKTNWTLFAGILGLLSARRKRQCKLKKSKQIETPDNKFQGGLKEVSWSKMMCEYNSMNQVLLVCLASLVTQGASM